MSIKKKLASSAFLVISTLSVSVPTFAGQNYDGGYWSYGCNNNPWCWGAFSNYYHGKRWHWSSVTRHKTGHRHSDEKPNGMTSSAFLNTDFGEHCYFN